MWLYGASLLLPGNSNAGQHLNTEVRTKYIYIRNKKTTIWLKPGPRQAHFSRNVRGLAAELRGTGAGPRRAPPPPVIRALDFADKKDCVVSQQAWHSLGRT